MDDFLLFTSIRYDPQLLQAPSLGFTNIGWNQEPSPFYMLDFHRDRMLRAAIHWNWTPAIAKISGSEGLETLRIFLQSITSEASNGPHRLMITLARDGTLAHQISPLPETHINNFFPKHLPRPGPENSVQSKNELFPVKEPIYEIILDSLKTAKSQFTHHKTTYRDVYNDARKRAQIAPGDKKEVLLINDDGYIMEGTISTPYFWRDGKWVTPPVSGNFNPSQGSGGNDGTTRRWALERYSTYLINPTKLHT